MSVNVRCAASKTLNPSIGGDALYTTMILFPQYYTNNLPGE